MPRRRGFPTGIVPTYVPIRGEAITINGVGMNMRDAIVELERKLYPDGLIRPTMRASGTGDEYPQEASDE